MANLIPTVGIMGFGVVGQAIASIVKDGNYIFLDPFKKNTASYEEILRCEMICICAPTPFKENVDEHVNYAPVTGLLSILESEKYPGIVVVRTTMPYSVLSKYTKTLNIVFVPEFLRDVHAYHDVQENGTYIIGGDFDVADAAAAMIEKHFENVSVIEIVSMKEACDLKMLYNVYGALKVLFWNMIQETTQNSRKLYNLFDRYCPEQGDMAQVGMDGKLGFSGKCFPKDLQMFIDEYKDQILPLMMQHYNRTLNKR